MLLLIKDGDELYAIDSNLVHEVIIKGAISKVPNSPYYLKGLCNYKNNIVPVVSFASLLSRKDDDYEILLIIKIDDNLVGLLVDSLEEVSNFNDYQSLDCQYINNNDKLVINGVYQGKKTIFGVDIHSTFEHLMIK